MLGQKTTNYIPGFLQVLLEQVKEMVFLKNFKLGNDYMLC